MNTPNRLFSIDFLRGLVMLLMTVDHVRDRFSSVSIGAHLGIDLSAAYYFTRWITHFCAPTFIFLSGLSIALWLKKYINTMKSSQMTAHIIKRGLFIIFLDMTIASLLWTIIENNTVFTIYLAELWSLGWSMVLLACLLKLSPRIILLIGLTIVSTHNLVPVNSSSLLITQLLFGNTAFTLIPGWCQVDSSYAILPWFGIGCVGYATGHYLTYSTNFISATKLFIGCAISCLGIFFILRLFNFYGDENLFVYYPREFLFNLYSFLDVTKYPPSLQYVLITLLPTLIILIFRNYFDKKSPHSALKIIQQFGQTPLLYYILHLALICLYYSVWSFKTDNLFVIYAIMGLVSLTAYPILLMFKKFREKYKNLYPILSYV